MNDAGGGHDLVGGIALEIQAVRDAANFHVNGPHVDLGQRHFQLRSVNVQFDPPELAPSWLSLASSHRTLAEILHRLAISSACSRGRRRPASASTRMGVSRFSIPVHTSRGDVAAHLQPGLHASNQTGAIRFERNESSHRPAALGDEHTFRVQPIHDRQTALFEARCGNLFHRSSVQLVISNGQMIGAREEKRVAWTARET